MRDMIIRAIENLDTEYSNASAVMGGALYAYRYAKAETMDEFILFVSDAIKSAAFFSWHDTPANAARTFCHICGIDPGLVEIWMGIRFETLVDNIVPPMMARVHTC